MRFWALCLFLMMGPALADSSLVVNGRHLEDGGVPVHITADTGWALAVGMDRADTEEYIDIRQGQGFNAIAFFGLPYSFAVGGGLQAVNQYGDIAADVNGNLNIVAGGTPDAPNDYWDHVDFILRELDERGMYALFLPVWGKDWVGNTDEPADEILTTTQMDTIGFTLGQRWANQGNIIWILGGDFPPNPGKYTHYRNMAEGILRGVTGVTADWNEGNAAWGDVLIGYHGAEGHFLGSPSDPDQHSSSRAWHNATEYWYDIDGFYSGHDMSSSFGKPKPETYTYDGLQHDYNLANPLPQMDVEPAYEGVNESGNFLVRTRLELQTMAIGGFFAGRLAGYWYGHHEVFNFDEGWPNAANMGDVGAVDFGRFSGWLNGRDWWTLVPNTSLVTTNVGGTDIDQRKQGMLGIGEAYVFYPERETSDILLTGLSGDVDATWWNPYDGTTSSAGTHTGGDTVAFIPPVGWTTAILELQATGAGAIVDRPRSPEQYLIDAGLWPAQASNTVAYQAKHEFPFYDSRYDTCDATGTPGVDAWPYDPVLVTEGLVGCYDLKPTGWSEPTDTVNCAGNSGVHPNHSNVYIIRAADWSTGYSNANSGTYRWVLRCAGFSATGTQTISADGVGVDAGELRIYDCLNADGTYEPMRPAVLRTGTADECHNQRIVITSAYTFVRSTYYEANTGQISNGASRVQRSYQVKAVSGFDNGDYYLGGQTTTASGYNETWEAFVFYAGTHVWFQNARIVDCLARAGNDGDGITFKDWNITHGRIINVEMVNCPRIINGTSGSIPSSHPAGGHKWENIWITVDGANFYGDANKEPGGPPTTVSYEYWRTVKGYSSGEKIPYGRIQGEPPSYVKAAAASDGEVAGAFNCDTDKFSSNCPYMCNEGLGSATKQGIYPGTEPNLQRRIFKYKGRTNFIDTNNAIWDYRALPENSSHVTKYPTCGGSAGSTTGGDIFGGQHSDWGWVIDLVYGECTQAHCIGPVTGGSGYSSEATGHTVTNSLGVMRFVPGSDNQYMDEHTVGFIKNTIPEDVPGTRANYGTYWGMTYAMLDYNLTSTRPSREWFGSLNTGTRTMECTAFIDAENDDPGDTGITVDEIALYGSSVPVNVATGRFPTSGTYSKDVLSEFCFVDRPWTAIANGVAPDVHCTPNVIPAAGSPIEGQCTNAAP